MPRTEIPNLFKEQSMTILTISTLDNAKNKLSQLVAGNRQLIGVGVLLPDAQAEESMRIALIDVTEEVKQGRLDTANPHLVNAFIHAHQEEINRLVNARLNTISRHAVAGNVVSIC
jgi:hypothetical protein